MNKKILVVEDNEDLAGLLEIHLRDMSCDVKITHDGISGMEMADEQYYDLIILDLMLPGFDGLEILRRVRAKPSYTPVLILTSKSSELDRVLGLEIGADDYVTKPFSIRELLARVKAIFRRIEHIQTGNKQKPSIIKQGDITVDPEKRLIIIKDKTLALTAKEFDLLSHFIKHPGRVYTRSQLLDEVWGYGHEGYEHTVNSHINRLRAKIEEDPTNPRYILTVWGVGYKFAEI
jgi:DNA-binding response OmpR family regulator